MWSFLMRRILYMIPTLIIISIISFVIIQLPPGDYLTTYMTNLAQSGQPVDDALLEALRHQYGLDQPTHVQYWKWISGIVSQGNFGFSFEWNRPVSQLIGERLVLTIVISLASLLFAWIIALPVGILSAVRQYSFADYFFSFFGFLGLAIPNFMLAIILMYVSNRYFGTSVGGLFSPEYRDAAWSIGKVIDMMRHLWVPMLIIGTAGTAGLIRITRANLLDELSKPYVETARAKGMKKAALIIKYPVRIAINPFFSTIGFVFPQIISGEVITSVVLNLPTTGPLLLQALMSQDMYLAGSFVMILAVLTVFGTLVSDILLALLDPRIRYD